MLTGGKHGGYAYGDDTLTSGKHVRAKGPKGLVTPKRPESESETEPATNMNGAKHERQD